MIATVATLLALVGCASQFYEQYAAANPNFDPARFPRIGSGLFELLAGLYQPRTSSQTAGDSTIVNSARIFDVTTAEWKEIPFDQLSSFEYETRPDSSYLVVANLSCGDYGPFYKRWGSMVAWYLVLNDQLVGFSSARFEYACHPLGQEVAPPGVPYKYLQCISAFRGQIVQRRIDLAAHGCGAPPSKALQLRPAAGT